MTDTRYTTVREIEDVTQEMLDAAVGIMEGWYPEGKIDWDDFWDRLDGTSLEDGTHLDLDGQTRSPAFLLIRMHVLKVRRTG